MTTSETPTKATASLVQAMLQSYGQLALILDHMQRSAGAADESIPDVIARLMGETLSACGLEGLSGGRDRVADAAAVLARATEILGEQILLVDESFLDAAKSPASRGRSGSRGNRSRRRRR